MIRTYSPPLAGARQAADLESLAKQLNPTVGFYDPLGFAKSGMGEAGTLASEEAVIGFLRQVREALSLLGLGLRLGHRLHYLVITP